MSLLRVCALAAQEDSESRETLAAEALKHTAFQSVENEMEAWRVLQRVVGDRLQEYPTDIAEDRRLLAREEDEDMVNVLRLRMGEKEVLMFYQCMARRVLRWLAGNARGQLTSYEPYALSLPL